MRRSILILSLFCLCLAVYVSSAPIVTIQTDSDAYQSGDEFEVSLSAYNQGEGMSVSLYVGLLTPESAIWTLSPYACNGWNETIEAWVPEIYVPASFDMQSSPFFIFDLLCANPPVVDPGQYSFAAVLTRAGTTDWICDLSLAPFEIVDPGDPSAVSYTHLTLPTN